MNRGLTPKERVDMDNLKAQNAQLQEIVREQADALIELAELIEGACDNG